MTALPSPGATFGDKYVVESQLGGGGAGVVYAATHKDLRQRVAIKVLRDAVPSTASERMLREARATLTLQSEHIVRIMDVGRDADRVFIVMEYLEGKDLATHLRERGKFPMTEAVDYVLQACAGIAEAHARGIIHRDLKPGNLFLSQRADGTPLVKVLDFGISKTTDPEGEEIERSLTGPAEVLGSPMYMSPEQIRHARDVDHRTDIWSLGVVLFRFLTGGAPFDSKGGGVSGMLAAVVGDPATSLSSLLADTPRGLETAVMRCLEKAPFARWSSIADLAAALSPFASDDGRAAVARLVRLRGQTAEPPAAKSRARVLLLVASILAFAASLVAAVVILRARTASTSISTSTSTPTPTPTPISTATSTSTSATMPPATASVAPADSGSTVPAATLATPPPRGAAHPHVPVAAPVTVTTPVPSPKSTARTAATNDRY